MQSLPDAEKQRSPIYKNETALLSMDSQGLHFSQHKNRLSPRVLSQDNRRCQQDTNDINKHRTMNTSRIRTQDEGEAPHKKRLNLIQYSYLRHKDNNFNTLQ